MSKILTQFHAGTNGRQPKPNVYQRSVEPRQTTDGFLLATAGFDTDKPQVPWYRKLKIWELGLLILGGVALCAFLVQSVRDWVLR